MHSIRGLEEEKSPPHTKKYENSNSFQQNETSIKLEPTNKESTDDGVLGKRKRRAKNHKELKIAIP